ncbi:MAG: BamA/TamA family outer membrane protein, partial [Oceanicoccus sp.]
YTKDGVSRGFSVFYREADLDKINVSRYTTNTFGSSLNFGYPIKETERLGFSLGYSNTEIKAGFGAVQEIIASPRLLDVVNVADEDWYRDYYEFEADSNVEEVPIRFIDDNGNVIDGFESILSPPSVTGFLDESGDTFDNFTITTSWTQSTLNRGRMATRGASQSLSLELTVPGSDLEYYKLVYNGQIFFPISRSWTLRLRTELGYGDGIGDDELPFFNHFYSGGFGSVRGFKSNTLGPRSTPAQIYQTDRARVAIQEGDDGCETVTSGICDQSGINVGDLVLDNKLSYVVVDDANGDQKIFTNPYENDPDPFGGNVLIEGGVELLFPLPFIKDQRSVRTAFFVDFGNVFSTQCGESQANCYKADLDELRYSFGVGLSWITGFGPLTFSYAKPFNDTEDDETEAFQFSLGRSF